MKNALCRQSAGRLLVLAALTVVLTLAWIAPADACGRGWCGYSCGPCYYSCGPSYYSCGPAYYSCGPAYYSCGPAYYSCGPVYYSCGPIYSCPPGCYYYPSPIVGGPPVIMDKGAPPIMDKGKVPPRNPDDPGPVPPPKK
jgi:hypothetical protein